MVLYTLPDTDAPGLAPALPHSDPQLRTHKTVLDSLSVADATGRARGASYCLLGWAAGVREAPSFQAS